MPSDIYLILRSALRARLEGSGTDRAKRTPELQLPYDYNTKSPNVLSARVLPLLPLRVQAHTARARP